MASRLKERGGGGAKIMASKPHKPLPEGTPTEKKISGGATRKTPIIAAAGKENPRPRSLSNGRASAVPAGVRWSTSSLPKGKPSNPQDLSKILRPSRGSLGAERRSFDGTKAPERPMSGLKALEARKSVAGFARSKLVGNGGEKDKFDSNLKTAGALRVPNVSREDGKVIDTLQVCGDKASVVPNLKSFSGKASNGGSVMEKSSDVGAQVAVGCEKKAQEKFVENIRVFENLNEKKLSGEGEEVKGSSNYPSKLHEKLALLEGKVQKIASDIRRTKEMLDQNKTDDSKMILSEIQSKISGLERAVGQVMDGSKGDSVLSREVKDGSLIMKVEVDSKTSLKVLNHEELEARFFPHHRLLKGRTSQSVSENKGQSLKTKERGHQVVEEGSQSLIDENSIALEFLASLDADLPEAKKNCGTLQVDGAAVRETGMESSTSTAVNGASKRMVDGVQSDEIALMADEKLEDFDDRENKPMMMLHEETEESCADQLFEIGRRASTSGWFVSEGEAVLLTHDDGSCSYYDIANSEEKSVYKPPAGVSNNLWGDCWLIRAPGVDGCSGRYVVAASAGNTLDSGFCSWDFYTKGICAFRVEDGGPNSLPTSSSRTALAPLTNVAVSRRSVSCTMPAVEERKWWYRPCGPLLISTSSKQKAVSAYDIRDGDLVMKWDVNGMVNGMEYSSPLQWRSRGKVVVAETEAISLWDVNSLNPEPLLSVASTGKKVYSIHVNNTDAEVGGGVRQRVSSSEVEGNDGVFCTQESVNVLDFRLPSGVGHRISRSGPNALSIFSRGDNIFIGSTDSRLSLRNCSRSCLQHYSLRRGKLMATFALSDSNSHFHHSSVTQVWGNSDLVMGISGMGLSVFDAVKGEPTQSLSTDRGSTISVKQTIGSNDLYRPTFDYHGSRVLVISRDRPAVWRYLA